MREETLARATHAEAVRNMQDPSSATRKATCEKKLMQLRALCEDFVEISHVEFLESVSSTLLCVR